MFKINAMLKKQIERSSRTFSRIKWKFLRVVLLFFRVKLIWKSIGVHNRIQCVVTKIANGFVNKSFCFATEMIAITVMHTRKIR
jgi:hypothetical protein